MVKNGFCENENFNLARDCIEVFKNHIRVYENCIKVFRDRIQESYKSARLLNLNPSFPQKPFLTEKDG